MAKNELTFDRLVESIRQVYKQPVRIVPAQSSQIMEYPQAGMDNQLFVSKNQLELPKREDMEKFLAEQIKEVGRGE